MTEKTPTPRQRNGIPKGSIPNLVLGLILLAAADFVVVTLLSRQGLIPAVPWLARSTQTGTPSTTPGASDMPSMGFASINATGTFTQLAETPPTQTPTTEIPGSTETPVSTRTPVPTPVSSPSPTPVFGPCQYTLKPGPKDFLYAIYWSWRINKNIPILQNFYAGISCALILSNSKCDYHAASPGLTQPGWVLILPGVSPNTCLYHGGTPVP